MAKKQNKKPIQNQVPSTKIVAQKQEKTTTRFSLNFILALLLGLISFALYANTLKNGYVLDDNNVITENSIVTKGIPAIPEILSTPYRRGYWFASNDLYRPLSLVMFAAEYQFFGKNPMPGHFINILLFAGCVILLFFFLDNLFQRKQTAVAFVTALLFAVHPIHTEVVANIKSRDELLCFFFAFLSLNVFIKYMQSGKMINLLLGFFCFFLSLLSKETVITFLAVIPLVFLFYRNENKTRSIQICLGAGLIAVVFLTIRFSVLNYYHANNTNEIDFIDNALAKQGLSFQSRIATAVLIMGYYIKLLISPYPLICDYSYNSIPYVTFSDPKVLISVAIYLFLIVFSVRLFLKNHKDPYAFGIFFFLIAISLFTNILMLIGATMGERFIFFASAGFCLVPALLIVKWASGKEESVKGILLSPKVIGIVIPVSVVFAIITIGRNSEWLSDKTLYTADIKKAPNNSRLNYNMGGEIDNTVDKEEPDPEKRKNKRMEAIAYLNKSIAINNEFSEAHATLGNVLFHNSLYDSAEVQEKRAIELKPKNTMAIQILADLYLTTNKYLLAVPLYKTAIQLRPNYVNSYANIGLCYKRLGKFDSAIYFLNEAVTINPDFNSSYEFFAATYKAMGKMDLAKKYEGIAKKNNPGFKL